MPRAGDRAHRRLFFALWPTDEFRAQIEAATLPIARVSGGRLIPPRNFHVTLLFLGEIATENFRIVQQTGAGLAGSPGFELRLDEVESWGRKVLCLTTSAPPIASVDLADRLRFDLRQLIKPDDRPYRPHVTLARDLPRSRPVQKIKALCLQAQEFVLVESVRDADGSHYSVVERWPLQWPLSTAPTVAERE